jgi:DNA-binding response OmpR family regulator
MTIRALIIDDDAEIVRTVGDIVGSHRHAHDAAGDQEGALRKLQTGKYDYLILDLDIPVAPGRLSRRENGRNLLGQIRQTIGIERLPVIVITGQDKDDPDFIVSVMKAGHGGWTDYKQKPITGDKLDSAICEALAHRTETGTFNRPAKGASKALEPFNATKREMVIYEDRVTICGIEVWRATYQPDLGEILVRLSTKEGGGYVRISGSKLMKELDRDASNPIGRPIKSFCDNASERLKEHRALDCGRYDIVAKGGGGYHFTDWMDVRVGGEDAAEHDESGREPDRETDKPKSWPALNDRQKWILEQLAQGVQLRHRDIVRHTRKNRSTINRDLKNLRGRGLITTHAEGHYLRSLGPHGPLCAKGLPPAAQSSDCQVKR